MLELKKPSAWMTFVPLGPGAPPPKNGVAILPKQCHADDFALTSRLQLTAHGIHCTWHQLKQICSSAALCPCSSIATEHSLEYSNEALVEASSLHFKSPESSSLITSFLSSGFAGIWVPRGHMYEPAGIHVLYVMHVGYTIRRLIAFFDPFLTLLSEKSQRLTSFVTGSL